MKIRDKFNKYADSYDTSRKQLIPCYSDFYGTILKIIPFSLSARISVLDLGAGTGLLSELIFQKFTNAQISLVDLSEDMLNIAKKRLEKHQNATYQILDYSKKLPNQKYDLIVSSLSIHHLNDKEKIELFSKIKNALCQNGIFINADQVLGESKEIEKIYQDNWLMEVKANDVTEIALSEAIDRMKEDKMAPLSVQLNWLRDQGFSQVDCWYKNYRFAVYSGINKN